MINVQLMSVHPEIPYRAIIVISANDYNHFPDMIYLPLLSIPSIFVGIMKGKHNSIKIQSFIA